MRKTMLGLVSQFTPVRCWNFASGLFPADLTFSRPTLAWRFNNSGILEAVANHMPRIDYDPITLECVGYLHEERRTNQLLYSKDFSNAVWGKFNCTPEISGITNLDNTASVWKITNTGSGNIWARVRAGLSGTVTVGNNYTASAVFWAGNTNYAAIVHSDGVNNTAVFALTGNGSVVSTTTGVSASIKHLGAGRYRCEAYYAITSASYTVNYGPASSGSTNSNPGDYIFASFPQGEQGKWSTSIIPTTSAVATRDYDTCSIVTGNWFNRKGGTFFAESRRLNRIGSGRLLTFDNVVNDVILGYTENNNMVNGLGPATYGSQIGTATDTLNWTRMISATSVSDCWGSVAGGLAGSLGGISGTKYPDATMLRIAPAQGSNFPNGHTKKIEFWPHALAKTYARALTS
ncbi:phage head spike fiber domain-containing protein [Arsenicibacter rosenii]|uniref:Uncharacterized protein n=1 Tax=Arsenicibacter rosenii TaxID=1750698 RepID=A0A1S2VTE7_9BACT|nr:hypothetical protein [Arsenicibacter rosenii]OIN61188.1 hypothetical protein BLX24_03770 [Arsenicibacter rosenii]